MQRRSCLDPAFICLLLVLLPVPMWAAADPSAPDSPTLPAEVTTALASIAGHSMIDSHAYQELQQLSDDIGGRLTGSSQAAKAVEWGLAKMQAIGLTNVHAETWQLSRGWARVSASALLIAPIRRPLTLDSMGWTGSTPQGGTEDDIVEVNVNQLDQEMKNNSTKWAGKILLVVKKNEEPKEPVVELKHFARFGAFLRTAYAVHAVGVIGGQAGSPAVGMHLTHTGILGFDTYYEIPVVSLSAEDQLQLERFLDQGKTVRLKLDVQNHITNGPVPSANVIGEIRGAENPEQVVVIGSHLDSWDLADGSTDDGIGVAATLGAAEAIAASGQRPRRTIRFVLFTGEEQGLLGSLAYTKEHRGEMADHVAALVLDNGQGPVIGLNLGIRDDLVPAIKKFTEFLWAFGDLKVDDKVVFSTDCGPFTLAGLPGINMAQDATDYKFTHHSAVDTFDKVKPESLARNATLMALIAFWIADRLERLASPWSPNKTAGALVKRNDDELLKDLGLWPFGNHSDADKKD